MKMQDRLQPGEQQSRAEHEEKAEAKTNRQEDEKSVS